MKNNINALILCGGRGTRYNRHRKKKILKPLVNINGKTILERIIEIYYKNGVSNFILLGGYKIKSLKSFVRKKLKNYDITVLDTGIDTETGGRLLLAKKYVLNNTFLFTYGDSIADFNLSKTIKIKKKNNFIMSFYEYKFQYGVLEHINKELKNIYEKNYSIPINAGFYILDNGIFSFIKSKKDSFEKKVLPRIINSKYKIILNKVKNWYPMDNLKDKKEMEIKL